MGSAHLHSGVNRPATVHCAARVVWAQDLLAPDGVFLSGFVVRNAVYEEQARKGAADAGLIFAEADKAYLPSPMPPLIESTLACLEVKLLVIAWRQDVIDKWVRRPALE